MIFKVGQAQDQIGLIIKTRPYQGIVFHNPNIGLEKLIGQRLSIDVDIIYLNREWILNPNTDVIIPFLPWRAVKMVDCDGVKFLIGAKYYFIKPDHENNRINQQPPFGWFITIQGVWNRVTTYDLERYEYSEQYTYNQSKEYPELYLGVGYQFYIFNALSMEVYSGWRYRFYYEAMNKKTSGDGIGEVYSSKMGDNLLPYVSFTVGYYIK